ncbi:MAG: iron-containing alcohol dehydrogenase [Planctomycetes bacterium]|nr:iron-containing alcohol dehydrogenase [Planctomycetota bacterium]
MSPPLQLNFPRRSYVGWGAVEMLGEEAARFGSKALLLTGRSALRQAGVTDRLVELLSAEAVETVLFEDVPPEPDVEAVDGARERIRQEGCDLVVEAGGGSAMDVGKAAAALAREEAPTAEFHAGRRIGRAGLPHVAIATTAGTGAEVTRNAVITDHARNLKKSIRGAGVMPTVSITDPELTMSCSPEVTASAGMDALVHAVESFFSIHAIRSTEALSLGAAELILSNLPEAFEDGGDRDARAAMAEGGYMAGLALGSARVGAAHGMAHPVGLCYGLPHGVVCAILMPAVLSHNLPGIAGKYEHLRRALEGDPIQIFSNLLDELELPHSFGPPPDERWRQIILDYALSSGSSRANPIPVDQDYVLSVLEDVTTESR